MTGQPWIGLAAILIFFGPHLIWSTSASSLVDRVIASHTGENGNKIYLCGDRLKNFLQTYCYTIGTGMYSPGSQGPAVLDPHQSGNSYPRIRTTARLEPPNRINKKWASRGITDECCTQPCSPSDLNKYCKAGGSVRASLVATTTTTTTPAPTEGSKLLEFDDFSSNESQSQNIFRPLLLNLLWSLLTPETGEATTEGPAVSKMATNYLHQPAVVYHQFGRLPPGRLSPRDLYARFSGPRAPGRSRYTPSSDETRRDSHDSDEVLMTTVKPIPVHKPPTNWGSQARHITDDLGKETFAISSGTNYADTSELGWM